MKVKLFKKTMGVILSASMLLSCFMFSTAVSAADAGDSISVDFENWTNDTIGVNADKNRLLIRNQMPDEWQSNQSSMNFGSIEDTGDVNHGKAYKLNEGSGSFNLKVGKTSGQWEIGLDLLTPSDLSNMKLIFYMGHVWGTPGDNVPFNGVMNIANKNSNGNGGDGTDGNVYINTLALEGNKYVPHTYAGTLSPQKWYKIKVFVDLETKLYHVAVFDNNTKIIGRTMMMQKDTDLNIFGVTDWGQSNTLIDNVEFKPYNGHVTEIINESFDNYTQIASTMSADSPALANSYWWSGYWNRGTAISAETTAEISNQFASDPEHTKVLKVGGDDGKSLAYNLSRPITSGKIRISGQVNIPNNAKPMIFAKNAFDGSNHCELLGGENISSIRLLNKVLLSGGTDVWYDLSFVLDMDTKTGSAQVWRDGKKIMNVRNVPIDSLQGQFCGLSFVSWTGTPYYLDNFSIEKVIDRETENDYVIIEDNFENDEEADYTKDSWTGDCTVVQDDAAHGKVIKVGNNVTFAKTLAPTASGKMRFSFDAKAEGNTMLDFQQTDTSNDWSASLGFMADGIITHTFNNSNTSNRLCGYTLGDWVRFENEVDFDKHTITYTVKNMDGAVIGTYKSSSLRDIVDRGDVVGVRNFRVRNWGGADKYVYLDNIKIEYGYDKPTLTARSVSAVDVKDTAIENIADGITPALKEMTLDFKDPSISPATLTDAVSLTAADGTAAEFSGAFNDGKYIMTLGKCLKANTKYTLSVKGTVENSLGFTLGNDFALEFTTGDGVVYAETDGVYNGDTKLTNISGLAANQNLTVKVNTINSMENAVNAVCIVAYYNQNLLLTVQLIPMEIAAGMNSQSTGTITLPDMTDVTSMKVFLWNSPAEAVPYCPVMPLPKAAE